MVFTNGKIYDNPLWNGKIYKHKSGEKIFSSKNLVSNYLEMAINNSHSEIKSIDYFIGILWGDSRDNALMDFFGYKGLDKNWKGNPDVFSWVVKNGIWRKDNNITCGEGIILLGKEEEFRRKTKNIKEYMKSTLDISELNKLL